MRQICFLFLCLHLSLCPASESTKESSPPRFRISIYSFPKSLDPQLQNSSASYVFQSIFRNLLSYKGSGILEPDLAEKCEYKTRKSLVCTLRKDLKWNNGSKLTAEDFLNTYRRILSPTSKAQRPDLLFSLVNAKDIYEGKKPVDQLGVKIVKSNQLQFEFNQPDGEFEYNLSGFYLSPTQGTYDIKNGSQYLTNGPYQIQSWENGKSIILSNNPYYWKKADRPLAEFLVIEEDSVSLRLYEKGELSFVRRLPSLLIPQFQKRPDFLAVEALRFDYIGFGPDLKDLTEIRKALALSLDYDELQKLLFSIGRPGCPGLPDRWTSSKKDCFILQTFKPIKTPIHLKYFYSSQGGEDPRRTAEWLQAQWKKNLSLEVQVRGIENKSFVADLRKSPPPLFRKGLGPDRPTCSGVMEYLTSGHPENFLGNKNPLFDGWVAEMRQQRDLKKKQALCRQAIDFLMDNYRLIPLGNYNFSMLASPSFSGWRVNELNTLDLSELRTSASQTEKPK